MSWHSSVGDLCRAPWERAAAARPAATSLAAALLLGACTVQVQNTRPAEELAAQAARAPGSVYLGWRVYSDKCASCHGPAATGGQGSAPGPDLLARMSELGPRRFAHLVLVRYDLDEPGAAARARDDAALRDARIGEALQRRDRAMPMPAWQGEPRVSAHILDLYAYLAARAEGRQGPGRPPP